MTHVFLSDPWFEAVDELIAHAGDLRIPATMRAVEINITVKTPRGDVQVAIKEGVLTRGHRAGAPTQLVLDEALARKVFVEADTAAGVQAFLAGELQASGDLKGLVAMQMEEPSAEQRALAQRIAAITSR